MKKIVLLLSFACFISLNTFCHAYNEGLGIEVKNSAGVVLGHNVTLSILNMDTGLEVVAEGGAGPFSTYTSFEAVESGSNRLFIVGHFSPYNEGGSCPSSEEIIGEMTFSEGQIRQTEVVIDCGPKRSINGTIRGRVSHAPTSIQWSVENRTDAVRAGGWTNTADGSFSINVTVPASGESFFSHTNLSGYRTSSPWGCGPIQTPWTELREGFVVDLGEVECR